MKEFDDRVLKQMIGLGWVLVCGGIFVPLVIFVSLGMSTIEILLAVVLMVSGFVAVVAVSFGGYLVVQAKKQLTSSE